LERKKEVLSVVGVKKSEEEESEEKSCVVLEKVELLEEG
jgi:hypothetical protein